MTEPTDPILMFRPDSRWSAINDERYGEQVATIGLLAAWEAVKVISAPRLTAYPRMGDRIGFALPERYQRHSKPSPQGDGAGL